MEAPPAEDEFAVMRSERIAGIGVGATDAEVEAALGPPTRRGEMVEDEATGATTQRWEYPAQGLQVRMVEGDGRMTVSAITMAAPSRSRTIRGIAIGSPRELVLAKYGEDADPDHDAEAVEAPFIAGSMYGGVVFHFDEAQRVREVFVGAAAE